MRQLIYGILVFLAIGCTAVNQPEPTTAAIPITLPPATQATITFPTLVPATPTAAPSLEPTSSPSEPTAGPIIVPAVAWTHTDEAGQCRSIHISREWVEVRPCAASTPSLYPLNLRRQAELDHFLARLDNFVARTRFGDITFKNISGTGQGAVPFPANERQVAIWAATVAQEAETGETSQTTVLLWQREVESGCQRLQVYLTGFAYAYTCDNQLLELAQTALSHEDLVQLYEWYDTLAATQTDRFELAGQGSIVPDIEEEQNINYYAENLLAALATTIAGTEGAPVEPLLTAADIRVAGWSPDGRWLATWLSSQADIDNQAGYNPGRTLSFTDVVSGQMCEMPQFHTEADQSGFVDWTEDGAAVVTIGESAYKGQPCQAEPFTSSPIPTPEQAESSALTTLPDGRYLVALGYLSGQWQYRLFLLER